MPIYQLSISLASLCTLLVIVMGQCFGCLYEVNSEKIPEANAVVSFNNRPASEAVPYFEQNDDEDLVYMYNGYMHKLMMFFLSLPLTRDKNFTREPVPGVLKNAWIVGSAGYLLMDWVLVPYTHHNLSWTQHAFNQKIGELRRIAKEAFARLKGRWCCLQKRTEVKLQDLPVVLGACCVLHNIYKMRNICEMRKE